MQLIFFIISFQLVIYGNERWGFSRNARIASLGEASSSIIDPGSFLFNPATSSLFQNKVIQATFSNYFSGFFKFGTFNFIAGDSIRKFFTSLNYIFSDNIYYTIYEDTVEASNIDEIVKKGVIKINSIQILGGFSNKLKNFNFGLLLKFMRENLYVGKGYGIGMDVGFLFSDEFNFSFSLRNFLGSINLWDSGRKEYIPTSLRVGFSKNFLERILFSFDTESYFESRFRISYYAGLEAKILKSYFIRAGWRENIPTIGFGFRIKNLDIDYAIGGNFELSAFHIVSLSCILR
ncbi:MAG: hypothetical protein ABDH49_07315 [Candidatus Hydrothermales bacterium]